MRRIPKAESLQTQDLKSLSLEQVLAIDRALAHLGPNGQVHLLIQQGHMSRIKTVQQRKVIAASRWRAEAKARPGMER